MVLQDGAFYGLENELLEPPIICEKTIRVSEAEIAILEGQNLLSEKNKLKKTLELNLKR